MGIFSASEAKYKVKILAYKLRRENEQGLNRTECIRELKEFMEIIGLSKGESAKMMAVHMKHYK